MHDRLNEIGASAPAMAIRKSEFWKARRPRHLLSGRIMCGVCDHPLSMIGKDHLACACGRLHGPCSNRTGMRRGELETLILDALQQNLMQPHLVEEFVRGNQAQINSARRVHESECTLASRQIAEVERKLQHLLDALSEDIRGEA